MQRAGEVTWQQPGAPGSHGGTFSQAALVPLCCACCVACLTALVFCCPLAPLCCSGYTAKVAGTEQVGWGSQAEGLGWLCVRGVRAQAEEGEQVVPFQPFCQALDRKAEVEGREMRGRAGGRSSHAAATLPPPCYCLPCCTRGAADPVLTTTTRVGTWQAGCDGARGHLHTCHPAHRPLHTLLSPLLLVVFVPAAQGVTEPEATFSACFGSAFLMWHPTK